MVVRVQETAFDLGAEVKGFAEGCKNAGAVVTFTGLVRDLASGNLDRMLIEHSPGMTEKAGFCGLGIMGAAMASKIITL